MQLRYGKYLLIIPLFFTVSCKSSKTGSGTSGNPDAIVSVDDGDAKVTSIEELNVGYSDVCVIADKTRAFCWGQDASLAEAPKTFTTPRSITAGGSVACVLDNDKPVCWGGFPSAIIPETPTKPLVTAMVPFLGCAATATSIVCNSSSYDLESLQIADVDTPTDLAVHKEDLCIIDKKGLRCARTKEGLPTFLAPKQVRMTESSSCALGDEKVICWRGDSVKKIPTLTHPTAIAVGLTHACAIDSGGVKCWGDNKYGQLDVPKITNPTLLSAYQYYTCAAGDSGVQCWGTLDLFDGTKKFPVPENLTDLR